jgi:hypothetical protein
MTKFLLPLLLLAQTASAGEGYFRYGFGIWDDVPQGTVKYFSLGYQEPLGSVIRLQGDIGLITDSNVGRASSGILSLSTGPRTRLGPFYAECLWGVGYLTHPDGSRLSGHLQFVNDVSVGLVGENGATFGLSFRHISNAGISQPNIGRDFLTLRVGIEF